MTIGEGLVGYFPSHPQRPRRNSFFSACDRNARTERIRAAKGFRVYRNAARTENARPAACGFTFYEALEYLHCSPILGKQWGIEILRR